MISERNPTRSEEEKKTHALV